MRPRALAMAAHLVAMIVTASAVGVLVAAPWSDVTTRDVSCSPAAVATGVAKARAVKSRTDAILGAGHFVREDPSGLFLYQTPHGQTWMPLPDDLWSLAVVEAEQEQHMYGAPQRLGVHRGDVVLDVGAHVGLFAKQALAAGAAKVITFEVTPRSNQALRQNLKDEIGEGRVVVIEQGAWFEEATMPLVIVERCSVCNSVSHPWMRAALDVPLTTIDRVVRDLGVDRVDFIKLDIENAEANALRGATDTVARHRPRLAVALENAKDRMAYAREVIDVVRGAYSGYHYRCGAVTPPTGTALPLPEVLHFYP